MRFLIFAKLQTSNIFSSLNMELNAIFYMLKVNMFCVPWNHSAGSLVCGSKTALRFFFFITKPSNNCIFVLRSKWTTYPFMFLNFLCLSVTKIVFIHLKYIKTILVNLTKAQRYVDMSNYTTLCLIFIDIFIFIQRET